MRYGPLLLLAACVPAPAARIPAPVPATPAKPVIAAEPEVQAAFEAPDEAPLPAGIYYRLHTYRPCRYIDDAAPSDPICTTPTHALIAGSYADPRAAEEVARRFDALSLAPGYPLVVHDDELGAIDAGGGIVVVVGQFSEARAAERWRDALAEHLDTRVVALLDDEAAMAKIEKIDQGPALVARIMRRTPAYGDVFDDATGEPLALPPTHHRDKGHSVEEPQTTVRCTLPAGTVVAIDGERLPYGYYSWAPIQCPDGSPAWVSWKDTTLGVTVHRAGDHHEVIRLAGAECDSPWFETWVYRTLEQEPARVAVLSAAGGCGS